MRLENKVAIVTGSGSGIGFAIAEKFISEGARVVFSDINNDNSLVLKFGEKALFIKCDVSKSGEVDDLINKTIEHFGKLDVMVNNAGIGGNSGILDITDESWDKTISINLSGTMFGMRAAAKAMKTKGVGGSIINLSSILGKVGFNGAIAYCASKGGVVQLTHAGALDLASYHIRVNAIAPGFIETNMTKDVLAQKEINNLITSSTPLAYVGKTEDIASAAVYLASDETSYVTGSVIYVDGGWTAK
ncbi:MAG: SDR family NAD(P)-dependent oxidoreductase [Patescibacteria group bacterium]|nr:SDR family NAD(P)-dependent oxidoreductase [Patescibacteria group bacterium]MDD4304375.1 SDR family NAD(P)-dependent oxidoreductase [Patescibacteria group bacterium]MDD4695398.1 SDR family NAD(P)-dependent oxidoreductase [Patescibacteria group bacterium]